VIKLIGLCSAELPLRCLSDTDGMRSSWTICPYLETIENHDKNGQNHSMFLKKIGRITEESRQQIFLTIEFKAIVE